ncbi:MAG: PHP domain-containing protein [Bianqueaceae bacterium]
MYDYHLHTRYSMDSDAAVESMIQAAIDKGIKEIAVTDHIDYEFPNPGGNLWVVDMDDYLETLAQMQQKYRGQIVIRRELSSAFRKAALIAVCGFMSNISGS